MSRLCRLVCLRQLLVPLSTRYTTWHNTNLGFDQLGGLLLIQGGHQRSSRLLLIRRQIWREPSIKDDLGFLDAPLWRKNFRAATVLGTDRVFALFRRRAGPLMTRRSLAWNFRPTSRRRSRKGRTSHPSGTRRLGEENDMEERNVVEEFINRSRQ